MHPVSRVALAGTVEEQVKEFAQRQTQHEAEDPEEALESTAMEANLGEGLAHRRPCTLPCLRWCQQLSGVHRLGGIRARLGGCRRENRGKGRQAPAGCLC
jgi:hypothetical protein